MSKKINVGNISLSNSSQICIIAGLNVLEDHDITIDVATSLQKITKDLGIPFIFKASFDKANRTSIKSDRGLGIDESIEIFDKLKSEYDLKKKMNPTSTDF